MTLITNLVKNQEKENSKKTKDDTEQMPLYNSRDISSHLHIFSEGEDTHVTHWSLSEWALCSIQRLQTEVKSERDH